MEGTRWEFPFRNVRNEVPEIKNYPDLMEDFLDYAPKRIHNILFMVEINYLKYILGLKKTPVSPYIMAGLGIMYYPYQLVPNTPLAESDIPLSFPDNFNEVYNIGISKFNPLQNKDDFAREESVTTLSIPFGMGVKTHIGPRFGIGVEFIIQKLFDDKLDNLDDPLAHINPIGDEITYSNLLHNNDFTAYLGINLTYKIYLGKEICPAYESKN